MEAYNFKFYDWEERTPDAVFLRQPFGSEWEEMTWKEAGQMARKLAAGLLSLGLPPKSHIGLVSKNCREWVIADIAITMAGMVSVPFYPTLGAADVAQLIEIGDVAAIFVGKIEDWPSMKDGIKEDLPMITFPHYQGNSKIEGGYQWHDFIEEHEPLQGKPSPALSDIWTIVFTSGTTGTPKGVVLGYDTLDATEVVTHEFNHLKVDFDGDNHFFSFLPLNHIAERVVVEQNCIGFGGMISFSESLERFADNLRDAQPTLFFAVPRIWTKFQLGILSKMPQAHLDAALASPDAEKVKAQLRFALGMSKIRGCITGAASIPEATKEWFRKLDIPIAEGYGMTENTALCTSLEAKLRKPGSVGVALPGVEIRIDPDTQEIQMRAPYVMRGYYKEPEKTAATIKDGWLRTGDQGRIDEDGCLYITGRVKDTFKTGKGQFIVPAKIEKYFEDSDLIEQICLVGLGCPQPIALIVPSDIGKALDREDLKEKINVILAAANEQLPNYQRVSTVVLVKDVWDAASGFLTPTLKVKRNVMHQRYQDLIMGWHEDESSVIWE